MKVLINKFSNLTIAKISQKIYFASTNAKWLLASAIASLFWYVSLFPGRLGYDLVLMIKMIAKNESTDWWTAIYFWFFKLTTFEGKSIWLASLLSLATLYFSMIYFLYSLNENKKRIQKIAFLICLSPLFGNFAVNINHDTFFSAGVLLLLGYSLRNYYASKKKIDKFVPYLAVIFLLNAKTGYVLICVLVIYIFLKEKKKYTSLLVITFALVIYSLTGIGITKLNEPVHYLPFLADIKCVAQHPEARINQVEWDYLEKILTLQTWRKSQVCWSMDQALTGFNYSNLDGLKFTDFLKVYFSIVSKNPAIVIQAHLQRSSMALPPPFFQGPQNQVDRNIDNPVGLNTNIALQLGSPVLHPSIDYQQLKLDLKILKPLESIALFGSFIINQASWFWGWGGLWLWPILIYFIFKIKIRKILEYLALLYPLIFYHVLLILISPAPLLRYVMSTVLVGFALFIFMFAELLDKTRSKQF